MEFERDDKMKKFRTVAAVIIMLIFGFIGLFVGALLNSAIGGVISGVLISGIACVIYAIDNSNDH